MQTSRIILAAVAVLSIATTAPAEARRHQASQSSALNVMIDVAAIPAYPLAGQVKTAHIRSQKAARKRPVVLASLSPADASQTSLGLSPTLNGYRDLPPEHPTAFGLVTVHTAAGIDITCSTEFAPAAAGLIATAVAQGIRFSRITCYSRAGTHVSGSNHHDGNAMDTHPSIPANLVRQAGLRSGCDFSDCMHVDNARNVGGMAYWNHVRHGGAYAAKQSVRKHYAVRHHRHIRFAGRGER